MNKMFDLEQKLLNCWNITDDLRDVLDKWDDMNSEERKRIDAIYKFYSYKMEDMWATFEETCSEVFELKKHTFDEPPF